MSQIICVVGAISKIVCVFLVLNQTYNQDVEHSACSNNSFYNNYVSNYHWYVEGGSSWIHHPTLQFTSAFLELTHRCSSEAVFKQIKFRFL